LTIHYFADEYQSILDYAAERGTDELTASRDVLGIAYYQLGADVAHAWNFPQSFIQGMVPLPRGQLRPFGDDEDGMLIFIAAFANPACAAGLAPELTAANDRLIDLMVRCRKVWKLQAEHVVSAFADAAALTCNYAKLIKVKPEGQPSLELLQRGFTLEAEADNNAEVPVQPVNVAQVPA
jgi:hypothetical protein